MAVSSARAARLDFANARAAMERSLGLRDAAASESTAALEKHMQALVSDIGLARDRTPADARPRVSRRVPAGRAAASESTAALEKHMQALVSDIGVVRDRMPADARPVIDRALALA